MHAHHRFNLGRWLTVCAAFAVAAMSCAGAQAQPKPKQPPQQQEPQQSGGAQTNALQGFSQNRDQPVKINAASLEVRDRSKIATFSGNVHLVQGDTVLRCKTLVVFYDGDSTGAPATGPAAGPSVKAATPGPSGSQQIRRMEAKGDVVVTQKDQTATGDSAIYDMRENTVTLVAPSGGAVAVTQGGNVMRGERLVVDLGSGISHLKGGAKGVEGLIIPSSAKKEQGDAKNGEKNGGDKNGGEKNETRGGPDAKAAPKSQSANPKGLY